MLIKVNNLLQKLPYLRGNCQVWVTGTGIVFALFHLILTWRLMHRTDQVVINALFWFAILGILSNQLQNPGSDRLTRFTGRSLLGLLAFGSVSVISTEAWFVRLFPAVTLLSLMLLSGFQPRRYWRIGVLLLLLMMPTGFTESMAEQIAGKPVQVLTAQIAAFLLHYLGFNAVQQSTVITLNPGAVSQGAVDVLFRCTGIPLFILLLRLALLFLTVFAIPRSQQIRIIVAAAAIAFLLSSFRVALMAVLVQNSAAFAYWHDGDGAQVFSTGAIVLFGWFCQHTLPRVQID